MAEQRLTPEQLAEIQRQQQARQQQQQAYADVPQHQHVPVLLSIGYGGPALTAPPTSPRIVDASTVNTTRCIRYAAWYDPSNPDASGVPNTTEGSGSSAEAAAAPWRRPPLDLSACQRGVLEVSTASQRVLVQVSCRVGGGCWAQLCGSRLPAWACCCGLRQHSRTVQDDTSRSIGCALRLLPQHLPTFCTTLTGPRECPDG